MDEITPNPNVSPDPEECFMHSARLLRGFEMLEDPTKMSLYIDAANRWMELGALIHGVRQQAAE